MRLYDLITLSLRMFKARAMRTFLTVLGMSVGIAAIIFLVSFGYGLQKTLLQKITTSDALVTLDVTENGTENAITLNNETLKTLRTLPNVTDAIPVLELSGQGKLNAVTLDINTVSVPVTFLENEGLQLLIGRFFQQDEITGIVITESITKILNTTPEEIIGKSVAITLFHDDVDGRQGKRNTFTPKESYQIVGVVQGEENIAYLPLNSLNGFPFTAYTKIKVTCTSTDALDDVRTHIETLGLTASSISETIDQANKVFRIIQVILMVFGLIALIVSAIGMFNTMTITLLERTEEIGIMKAIGASKQSIALMFLTESTIMGLLGALGGVVLGFFEGEVLNILINVIATRFGGEPVDLFFSPLWFIVTVILFGAGVGFVTGIFPAQKASHIETLDALRYK